jgi:hypothetical protein
MKKLPCYGVTARALRNLEASVFLRETIPTTWFNWVGVASPVSPSSYAPRRVELVQANPKAMNSMASWSTNATASGYRCILIDSVDDDHCIDDVDDLPNDLDYAIVTSSSADSECNFNLLKQLREPERIVVIHWSDLRRGGGVSIEKLGFDEVTFTQWQAYGEAMNLWIEQTKGESALDTRVDTPDFSKWNPWEGRGGTNRMLSLEKHFNAQLTDAWPWNVENPITAKQIPNLGSDIEAFWPMRQMPFCGVVRTTKGVLKAVGALPDTVVNGNWLWDDGSIRAAFLATSEVKESLLAKIKRLFGNRNAEVSSWTFPSQAYADSGDEGGIHYLDNGECIEIIWNEDSIKISHTRSLGGTHDLWLSAITVASLGEELLGCWKYSDLVEEYSPGINKKYLAQSITFVITDFEVKGI